MKTELKDLALKKLKPKAKPYEVMDSLVKGLGLRILPTGVKNFILVKRFPGSPNPVRRTLGSYRTPDGYGDLTLAEAREKADGWNKQLKKKLDPKAEEARQEQEKLEAERKQKENTFVNAFESYLRDKTSKQRSGAEIERVMRQEFAAWMDRPLTDISQENVKAVIKAIKNQGMATKAHVAFGMLRTFYNWAIDTGDFNLTVSPCTGIKPAVLIGNRNIRDRVLKDFELAAYWRASEALGYPFGRLFQLLALTALRRNEAAYASWSEIDLDAKLWVIPAERMKGKTGKAKPHAVPLVPDILSLLDSLPRFVGGGFVFSTMGGRRPVSGFSKAKARLDALMCADLEAQGKPFEEFVLHDIRRTVRTNLSSLPMENHIREILLGHSQPGLHRVYDQHSYLEEKRDALTLWHARLRSIIEPKGAVIQFPASA